MKAILIYGYDDYSANEFESIYGGTLVSEIIKNIDLFTSSDQEWIIDIIEVGEVDKLFIDFIRKEIEDYDNSKHKTFYLENEKIRN